MRTLYGYVWDGETQSEWPLYLEDGKLYGFPNSSYDGTPEGDVAFPFGIRLPEVQEAPGSPPKNTAN